MIVIKLLGAGMLVLCGFFIGLKKAHFCEKRASILILMTAFLLDIRTCIKYKRDNSINMICELAGAEKYYPLNLELKNVAAPNWPGLRNSAMQSFSNRLCGIMPKIELELFCEALCSVGEANAQTEDEKLEYYCTKLKECAESASEIAVKNKKLYTGMGLFSGAAIAIILL